MQTWGLGNLAEKKIKVLEFLQEKKSLDSNYTIIDIGGAKEKHFPQKFSFIDYVLDLNSADTKETELVSIRGDINEESSFIKIEEYVKNKGKFNFSICTHTLEDIRNPQLVIKKLPQISKAGLLSFPSKYLELSRFEKPELFRGFHHHRWIFVIKKNKIIAIPKINMVEHKILNSVEKKYQDSIGELYIEWEGEIDFDTLNNDWLGPTQTDIFDKIKNHLLNSDEDELVPKKSFNYKSNYLNQFK